MLGRIARLYYDYNLTHQEIAELMGLSRIRVTRALAEARRVGIVKIEVLSDEQLFIEEENALTREFGLTYAWVAPPSKDDSHSSIAQLASGCLVNIIGDGMKVGVGLSSLLARVAELVTPPSRSAADFIPLQGTNPGLSLPLMPSSIAMQLAQKFGGSPHDLAVPLLPETPETASILRGESAVARAFDLAESCDIALVGVGGTAPGSSIVLSGLLSEQEAEVLRSKGAVGDINAHFFDSDGQPVESPLSDRLMALDLPSFSRIPIRIGIAGGGDKVEALRGALRGELLNGLVTDVETAQQLLS